MEIFHEVLSRPLFNLLIAFYNAIPGADIGFAIIALTILVKLILWPLSHKSLKSQKRLQDLQPKLDALKEEYKDDKEKLAKAMMELYSEEKVNPLSSCLPILIQLPILIALYRVLLSGLDAESLNSLYSFVPNPGDINIMFLGFIDLSQKHIVLAIIAGGLQFIQTKMLMSRRPPANIQKKEGAKDENALANMNQKMMYFMPIVTVLIGSRLPGGLTLYWVALNLITIIQQSIAFRKEEEPKKPVEAAS